MGGTTDASAEPETTEIIASKNGGDIGIAVYAWSFHGFETPPYMLRNHSANLNVRQTRNELQNDF